MSTDGKLVGDFLPLAHTPELHEAFATLITFTCLVFLWTCFRIYANQFRSVSIKIENILYYVSVVAFYGMVVSSFLAIYIGGTGHHLRELNETHISRFTTTVVTLQAAYGVSMCCSKWSILWMLKRIFQVRWVWLATWGIIIIQALWAVMTILIAVLICRPFRKAWDSTAQGVCADQIAAWTAVSAINVIIDVMMCILPLPVIFTLKTKTRYKIALLGIFSIGLISVVFSILRLLSLRGLNLEDLPYTGTRVITWTNAENGVIIMVACSPLLRPIFDETIGRCLGMERSIDRRKSSAAGYSYTSSTEQPRGRRQTRDSTRGISDSDGDLELGDITEGTHEEANQELGHEIDVTRQGAEIDKP